MAFAVIMPRQGQSVESCILTELHKKKGDRVSPGEPLFAYETDKASFEEEAKVSGEILEIFFAEGDEIPVLANVLVIGKPGEDTGHFRPSSPASPAQSQTTGGQCRPEEARPNVGNTADACSITDAPCLEYKAVSPRARALAEKYRVDTASIAGTGPEGRVIARDVISNIERTPKMTSLAQTIMGRQGLRCPTEGSGLAGALRSGDLLPALEKDYEDAAAVKPLSNMRKLIARAMFSSLRDSAQLTHHLGADARRILEIRKRFKSGTDRRDITINDMVCYAVVKALKEFPQVNSHLLGENMKIFERVHLGLAVDTQRGLMVPALRNADLMSLDELSRGLRALAEACRGGAVNPDILSPEAATFTVSNLGNYGVEMFTPIINLPQTAILGVNTILPRPKDIGEGVYAFVPHIGLSLTYDHRAIDGGEATRMLGSIARHIEHFEECV
ncbi:MAG: 2-oxo acid dehydrogenase subunit E2 [Alistipes sp.]|nr:2-oxo acid dehydrogenase subunit E2 [Alistipes sp.]